MMRLDKYLAERLGITRSESRKRIAAGAVTVDGALCRKADAKIDENTARVTVVPRLSRLALTTPSGLFSIR